MHSTEMLVEVLFPREAGTGAAFAVPVRAEARSFGAAVLSVNFACVSQETARIRESPDLLAARLATNVRTKVLVHVLTVPCVSMWRNSRVERDASFTYDHSHFLEKVGGFAAHSG